MDLRRVIKRCLRGDEKAYDKLYNRYMPVFAGICRRYAHSSDDVDDILQEAFIKIFNNLEQLKDYKLFEAWGKRIVINTAIRSLRNKDLFNLRIDQLEIELTQEEETQSVEMMSGMDISELVKLMDLLPEGYRTILNLYAVEDYSHKEIGEILDIREVTSRSQYFKAKKAFQKILLEKMAESNYERFVV